MTPSDLGSFICQPESETLLDMSREEDRDCAIGVKENSTPNPDIKL